MAVTIYSSSTTAGVGSTGTGLDQWVELIGTDPSLAGNGDAVAIAAGGQANEAQTNDLRILFNPNDHFAQEEQYLYPVVKMPKLYSILKLPRTGRSNQKGYKEKDFFNQLKQNISGIEMTNNVHMLIPNFNKPYEPDIVLFDKNLNLYH